MVELPLVLSTGKDRREFKLLPGGPPVVVGRGSDATLRIDQPTLSRRHFEVRYDEQTGVEVTDLGSANGTFVNGMIARKARLKPGDVLRAGDVTFRVEFPDGDVPRPRTGQWIAEAASGELRCNRCGRLISMSTVGDDQSFEWGDQILCPACKEGSAFENRTDALQRLALKLREEGFEILAKISSEGTLAPVFKAKRLSGLEDVVAIKALPLLKGLTEKKLERFKSEAKATAQIKHPNVVHIYDVRQRPDLIFLVMEFIEGDTLLKKIEKGGKLPVLEALSIGLAISRALEAASKQGIVHRNVKPGNIIISPDGTPKLVDFGLAKGVKSFGPSVTNEDETLGTIRYMPPEQVRDARAADARSDIYSLAATLFHALSGKMPYPKHSELDLLKYVVTGTLPEFVIAPGDKIPQPVAHVLARGLKRRPDERPATPTKFRETLVQAIFSVPGGRELLSSGDLAGLPASAGAVADPTPGAMQGAFDPEHQLSELVQMLGINSKTGTLVVKGADGGGEVHFQNGRIVGAKLESGAEGEAAAHAVLSLARGRWEFKPALAPAMKPKFNRSVEGILLETLKRKDEQETP